MKTSPSPYVVAYGCAPLLHEPGRPPPIGLCEPDAWHGQLDAFSVMH